MNRLEKYGIEQLKRFIANVEKYGLCHDGFDIDRSTQKLIVDVIQFFIEDTENE